MFEEKSGAVASKIECKVKPLTVDQVLQSTVEHYLQLTAKPYLQLTVEPNLQQGDYALLLSHMINSNSTTHSIIQCTFDFKRLDEDSDIIKMKGTHTKVFEFFVNLNQRLLK